MQLNTSGSRIQVDEETAGLLNYADACFQQSDGLFDISSGVLSKVWDFKTKAEKYRARNRSISNSPGSDGVK